MKPNVGLNASATININIGQNEILKVTKKIAKNEKKNYKLIKKLYSCKKCDSNISDFKKKIVKYTEKHIQDYHKKEKICETCRGPHSCEGVKVTKAIIKEKNFYTIKNFIETSENIGICYINRDLFVCKKHHELLDKIAYNLIWKKTIDFVFDKFSNLNCNNSKKEYHPNIKEDHTTNKKYHQNRNR